MGTCYLQGRDFNKFPLKITSDINNAPYSFELPDKNPSGYLVDFWKLWSKYNNIKIEFVLDKFPDNVAKLKNEQYDMYAGLFENEPRSQWALFTSPVQFVKSGFYFKSDSSYLESSQLNTKLKVGVIKDSYQQTYLSLHYPKLKLVPFSFGENAIKKLLASEIDAIFTEIPHQQWLIGKLGLTGIIQLRAKDQIGNPLKGMLPKWNKALYEVINNGIKNIPIEEIQKIERRWFPDSPLFFNQLPSIKNSSFTMRQIDWLIEHKSITLGIDSKSAPFEFIDKDGKFAGISSDYLKLINNKLKLRITQSRNHNWSDLMEMIKLGNIDMLSAIVKTKERQKYIQFSKPYLSYPVVIASRKDKLFVQNLDDLNRKTVGFVKGYFIKELLERDHPLLKLIPFNSVQEGLKAVNDGNVDTFIANIAVITHVLNNSNYNLVSISVRTPYNLNLSIGVRKGLEPLIPMINKVIDGITPEQRSSISNRWLALNLKLGTSFETFLLWISPVLIILTIIILYIYRTNRRLYLEASERKKVEKSLVNARIAAEKANKSKDEFLANVSHEIRTPMNAIVGMAHLLSHTALNNNQREYLLTLKSSADSLLELIDEILDLSKIESGKMELEKIPFKLSKIFHDIENLTSAKTSSNKLSVHFEIQPEVPDQLIGDPLRLKQIITNLISNAIKFTEAGEIKLSVSLLETSNQTVRLEFSVMDTGIGMNEEQMNKIFKTYSQADSSTTRKFGGTGLGLSICKNLCEMMNGKIWVQSKLNKGSTFYFTALFGLKEESSLEEQIITTKPINSKSSLLHELAGRKILLVDDNEVNLTIAFKILSKMGMKITSAHNGEQAIKAVKARPFDAVLMDIQMPVMDGYSATKEIRKLPEFKDLPIIAMTANVFPSDVKESLAIGMNAHLSKPLVVDDLINTLHKLIITNNHLS